MQATTIGLDIAKQVFQVHGADKSGKVLFRHKLRRSEVARFSPSWNRVWSVWKPVEAPIIGREC
jgi:hypothetical protein